MNVQKVKEKKVRSARFPQTRYQGSKYKLRPWLQQHLSKLPFDTVLDAFGGTASVSYLFKEMGKQVHFNDLLQFNAFVGKALVQNNQVLLTEEDVHYILSTHDMLDYDNFIERTFPDVYYTHEENRWLDRIVQNILSMKEDFKQAMAFWALFQAAISKRPYNLFHRKNLYVRTSKVSRTFGNKTTWDRPFEVHFRKFVGEINQAIFDNGYEHTISSEDACALQSSAELVYIDPPYIPEKGTLTLYRDFYHFLEGLVAYSDWEKRIDITSKHKRLQPVSSPWEQKDKILDAFERVFTQHRASIIVCSYRRDGFPGIEQLVEILHGLNKQVELHEVDYRYVLSKKNNCKEVLLIAT